MVFVDADLSCKPPYEYHEIYPSETIEYTTHAMSPQSLLSVYLNTYDLPLPVCHLLTIRGYSFELGEPISEDAHANMTIALEFLKAIHTRPAFI